MTHCYPLKSFARPRLCLPCWDTVKRVCWEGSEAEVCWRYLQSVSSRDTPCFLYSAFWERWTSSASQPFWHRGHPEKKMSLRSVTASRTHGSFQTSRVKPGFTWTCFGASSHSDFWDAAAVWDARADEIPPARAANSLKSKAKLNEHNKGHCDRTMIFFFYRASRLKCRAAVKLPPWLCVRWLFIVNIFKTGADQRTRVQITIPKWTQTVGVCRPEWTKSNLRPRTSTPRQKTLYKLTNKPTKTGRPDLHPQKTTKKNNWGQRRRRSGISRWS